MNHPISRVACFGEILWDILPSGTVPGGAPMNVAYHLHQLSESPVLITRVGNDQRGEQLKRILKVKGVDISLLQTDQLQPTGTVHGTADANGDMKYEIVEPAAWDFIESAQGAAEKVSSSEYFVFGSLCARQQVSRDTLFTLLRSGRTKVLDVNLRAPFYSEDLIGQLMMQADIVKLNEDESTLLASWWSIGGGLEQQAAAFQERFGLNTVIVTRGSEGAAIWHEGRLYEHPGYKVKVADTVGSGDAFLAGFLHQRLHERPVSEALAYACALGALVASRSGAWPDYSLNEINDLTNL